MSHPRLDGSQPAAPRSAIIANFASIYIVWGSTYLAIRFAVESLPPFLMASARFLAAGSILWITLRLSGAPRATLRQWRASAIVGTLLLAGGNGLVSWSEQWVPSAIAALIVGTMPLWMVLLEWILYDGRRPTLTVGLGLALGFAGVALLAGNGNHAGSASRWGVAALFLGCIFWAYGSLRSRKVDQGPSMLMACAMQMIGGGTVMLIIASGLGEWSHLQVSAISMKSILAFVYLVLVGALVGYTSYAWLLRTVSPTAVSTYAFVNPVVAVFLGWWLGNETISGRTLLAGAMVVGAVALMTMRRRPARPMASVTVQADPVGSLEVR